MGVPLRCLPSPYRGLVGPIMEEIDRFQVVEPDVCLTVIVPEFIPTKWWHRILHNQMAFRIKAQLMVRPGVIVTTVRTHLPEDQASPPPIGTFGRMVRPGAAGPRLPG
jgi:hypothetical protein